MSSRGTGSVADSDGGSVNAAATQQDTPPAGAEGEGGGATATALDRQDEDASRIPNTIEVRAMETKQSPLEDGSAISEPLTPLEDASSRSGMAGLPPAPPPSATPPPPVLTPPPTHPKPSPASGSAELDLVREHLRALSRSGKLEATDADRLARLLADHDALRDKVTKIKSLLGRSAKAQREAKLELEVTQRRLDQALREVERLQARIDRLASRPTHMELLADFETNFDRALLSVHRTGTPSNATQQPGGQDTAPPGSTDSHGSAGTGGGKDSGHFMDTLLLQEVQDAKARIEKLEALNQSLLQRSNALEQVAQESKREREDLQRTVQHLELEKRMAVMEAEQATRALHDKTASLQEMQLELDLVTKANRSVTARVEHEQERLQHAKTDRQHVVELEAQVSALQEWAVAANEAKLLAQERVRLLESQLKSLQAASSGQSQSKNTALVNSAERILFSRPGSLVVGAGDRTSVVVELSSDDTKSVKPSERVILRWRFDMVHDDAQIDFSILKSKCETKQKQKDADYLIKDRLVIGGAAGEAEHAFAIQNACTLVWCNSKAWIRPKTVRYNFEAVAIED